MVPHTNYPGHNAMQPRQRLTPHRTKRDHSSPPVGQQYSTYLIHDPTGYTIGDIPIRTTQILSNLHVGIGRLEDDIISLLYRTTPTPRRSYKETPLRESDGSKAPPTPIHCPQWTLPPALFEGLRRAFQIL